MIKFLKYINNLLGDFIINHHKCKNYRYLWSTESRTSSTGFVYYIKYCYKCSICGKDL
jgi:hypothetical protein